MKTLTITLFFIALTSIAFTQDITTEELPKRTDFGINATSFVNKFLNFNDSEGDVGDFLFTHRIYRYEKMILRMGFDIGYTNVKIEPDDDDEEILSSIFNAKYRVGWEKQNPIAKKWTFLSGYDFLTGFRNNTVESKNNFDDVKSVDWTYDIGMGPIVGFQFNINEKVGLFTESTFYLTYFINKNKITFDSDPAEVDKSQGWNFDITLPTTLYFFVKF